MSEDRLLHDLGRLAREEQTAENARLDERWDRLSAGTLTPEEEKELIALAETSPEAREAYEAFRPLGPEFQARVVQAIREQGLPTAIEPLAVKPPPGKLLFWPRLATRTTGWGIAAAAAAAILVISLWPSAPLPGYTLAEISGGPMRAEETEATDFAPGDHFHMVLRPDKEVSRARSLEARCFLLRDGDLRRLDVKSHVETTGLVELKGKLDSDLPAGACILWAVVGRRGKLPGPEELRSYSTEAPVHRRDWAAVPQHIRIRAP